MRNLAGQEGIAPPPADLETAMLLLHHWPMDQDSGLPGGQLFPGWVLSANAGPDATCPGARR